LRTGRSTGSRALSGPHIHGELDEYGSFSHPRRIAQGRGGTLILAGIGHVPHREAENALVAAIAGFPAEAPTEG
jgi:pimeloyl-ACP methyl ester carboxylesterase